MNESVEQKLQQNNQWQSDYPLKKHGCQAKHPAGRIEFFRIEEVINIEAPEWVGKHQNTENQA